MNICMDEIISKYEGLTNSQHEANNALLYTKDNLFITGAAGTGKSFIVNKFKKSEVGKDYPIIASTGAAAVLVGGCTFHSFFGLELMQGHKDDIINKAVNNMKVTMRVGRIDGFILDEISMLPHRALEIANEICQTIRNNTLPWGGIRVVAIGDFYQLPPVSSNNVGKDWAFMGDIWRQSNFKVIQLKEIMRCSDPEFLEILEKIRVGTVDYTVERFFDSHRIPDENQIQFDHKPFLHPRRAVVDSINRKCLESIATPLRTFKTSFSGNQFAIETLKKNLPIPEILELKRGALVMCRCNNSIVGYFNGTIGTIISIDEDFVTIETLDNRRLRIEKFKFQLFDPDGREIASAINIPLSLAYAVTIHKSQGATMDSMLVDLRNLWEPGQAYVALSRLRSSKDLEIIGWDFGSIRTDRNVVDFMKGLL